MRGAAEKYSSHNQNRFAHGCVSPFRLLLPPRRLPVPGYAACRARPAASPPASAIALNSAKSGRVLAVRGSSVRAVVARAVAARAVFDGAVVVAAGVSGPVLALTLPDVPTLLDVVVVISPLSFTRPISIVFMCSDSRDSSLVASTV